MTLLQVEKYHLKWDAILTYFEFISVGIIKKGTIRTIIEFQVTSSTGLYNLAFGDKNPETEEIDDLAISNILDRFG